MRNRIFSLILFGFAGCSAGVAIGPTPGAAEPNRFASVDECERLVDHMVVVVSMDTEHPRHNLFLAKEQDPVAHQDMVNRCTTTVNKAGYDCLMTAHDEYQVDECDKRPEVTASRFTQPIR